MAAVALRPDADRAAIIAEVNALVATPAAAGNVSASSAMRLVRGGVLSTGVKTLGEGFTSAKNSTGVYTITYTVAYAAIPVVVASITSAASSTIAVSSDTTTVEIRTFTDAGIATDLGFSFIAAGLA